MPRGDGSGPMGAGPMTGRGLGFCAGYPVPGYMNGPTGGWWGARGWFGRGGGRGGRGHRNWYYATGLTGWQRAAAGFPAAWPGTSPFTPPEMSAEQELSLLRNQVTMMEEGLKRAQDRIAEIEKGEKGS